MRLNASLVELLRKKQGGNVINTNIKTNYLSCYWLKTYYKRILIRTAIFQNKEQKIFIIFLDSTKLKIVCKKITTFFKRRVSIMLWSLRRLKDVVIFFQKIVYNWLYKLWLIPNTTQWVNHSNKFIQIPPYQYPNNNNNLAANRPREVKVDGS